MAGRENRIADFNKVIYCPLPFARFASAENLIGRLNMIDSCFIDKNHYVLIPLGVLKKPDFVISIMG